MLQVLEPMEAILPVESMSNEQLGELMLRCQDLIADGSATIDDFEAFVLCQKELVRRTWA